MGRVGRLVPILLAGVALWTCASKQRLQLPPASQFARSTLSRYDALLRHYVIQRDSTALRMLDVIDQDGPKDSLVRLLNRGLFLRRFGRYAESNAALQLAEGLAEDRYTKSITQNIAAFLISDNVLDYTPPAHERAMIHYYGMMNYLALGNVDASLVEARKANLYLARYNRDHEGRRTYSNDGFVQYVAGLLHWNGGDENDALVSLRLADSTYRSYRVRYGIPPPRALGSDLARLATNMGVPEVAERAITEYQLTETELRTSPGKTGELLVVIENGFIAHRVEEKIFIPILDKEKSAVLTDGDAVIPTAAIVLVRTVVFMNQESRAGRSYAKDHEGGLIILATAADASLVSFAWSRYDLDGRGISEADVQAPGEGLQPAVVADDLSAIAARDFEERKPKIMARMIVRGLLKQIAVWKAEATGQKKGGDVIGFLAKLGATAAQTLTERADVRSWSLLPGEIRIARLTLPAGKHSISVTTRNPDGSGRVVPLGDVAITAGRVSVKTAFVTGTYPGNRQRFRAATSQVDYMVPKIDTTASRRRPNRDSRPD